MYGRQPLNEFQLLTCPKCGAPQESPGSTVCELCGADIKRPSGKTRSHPSPLLRVARPLMAPVRAVARAVTAVLLAGLLVGRVVTLLLLLASLVMAASFVSEVNTLVPATKAVAAIARPWLQRAEGWAAARLASWETDSHSHASVVQSAVGLRKPAPVLQATQAVLISSTPSGATVRVNARTMGKTPMTLKLAPGSYTITINRSGYATVNRTITVRQGVAASLRVKLAPKSPSPGQASQHSEEPPGRSNGQPSQKNGDP